jgi:K+ transport systems, NAD-binding component
MSVVIKLFIYALLNFAALGYLLSRLLAHGNDLSGSLKLAWDLILGQPAQTDRYIYSSFLWIPILRLTWWLMVILYAVAWFISDDLSMSIGILLLLVIHVIWYLYASRTLKTKYDRVLRFTSDWGIIYQEIDAGSFLIQKSLAELDLRKKNLLVLAIERKNQLNPFPKGLEVIQAGDRIVMFGDLNAYHAVFG